MFLLLCVIVGLWLDDCCLLLVVYCLLFVVCVLLFVGCCVLIVVFVSSASLFVRRYLL